MEDFEVELLSDLLYRLYNELEDGMKYFLIIPYKYPDEIVDEVINIVDRLETLQSKLNDIDFRGSFRYGQNTTT
jgi:hypothetical protein